MAEQNDKPEKAEADKPPKGGKPVLTPEQEAEAAAIRLHARQARRKQARARAGPAAPPRLSLPPSVSSEVNRHACANFSRASCARA